MQVFVNISSKVAFILKSYVRQPSRVYQNFHGVPFPQFHSSFPEQGVTSYSSYTLRRCVTLPMRDRKLCCTAGSMFMFKLPWFEAQPKIQADHCPLCDL